MSQMHQPIIKVGILHASEIKFNLHGLYLASNGRQYSGKRKVAIYRHGKILFDGEHLDKITFTPVLQESIFELVDVTIGIGFHWQRQENQQFKGKLKLICENGKLAAINLIETEEYLTSVISSEMSASASEELLKAHAVISRSWLLKPILHKSKEQAASKLVPTFQKNINSANGFVEYNKWYERDAHINYDVCADDHCQRYQGVTRASTQAVGKAIATTRGEVLMYDDVICDARFSKSCGGISETFENCWAPEHYAYLDKVIDNPKVPNGFDTDLTIEENAVKWILNSPEAFCNTSDKKILAQVLNNYDQETTDFYRWKVQYSQAEISDLLCHRSGFDFGQIIDLVPVRRGESGRIVELKIIGTLQTVIVGKELEIRKWLSTSHLYSSAFVVEKSGEIDGIPQQFTLTGAGWGHGVGLCQIGAAVMGEKGYKYKEILLHYFKGVELKKVYS